MITLTRSIITLVLVYLWVACPLYSQGDIQFSAPYFNQFRINPAVAGTYDQLDMTAIYRKQWSGIENSPSVQNISAHIPFDILGGGIGINIYNQSSGAERWTTARLGYAYHYNIDETTQLNIGVAAGFINSTIDGLKLRTPDGTYINGGIDHSDPDLPLNKVSSSTIIGDFGIYLDSEKYSVGLSVLGLLGGDLDFDSGFLSSIEDKRTLNGFLAYNLDLWDGIRLIPHVYVKSDLDRLQTEIHAMIRYNDNLIIGGGLRGYDSNSLDAFIATVGVELKSGVTLLYAYDNTLSTLNTISSGSHEFVVKYNIDTTLGKGKPPRIIYNPRNL